MLTAKSYVFYIVLLAVSWLLPCRRVYPRVQVGWELHILECLHVQVARGTEQQSRGVSQPAIEVQQITEYDESIVFNRDVNKYVIFVLVLFILNASVRQIFQQCVKYFTFIFLTTVTKHIYYLSKILIQLYFIDKISTLQSAILNPK